MIFQSKQINLKNGKSVILRSPTIEDASELLQHFYKRSEESDFLLQYREEITMSLDEVKAFIENAIKAEHCLIIIAELDSTIIASCQIAFKHTIKTSHRAVIALAVLKDYWNHGLGTALLLELIKLSKTKAIMQLELTYIEGNQRAKTLYDKLGFEEISNLPNAIQLKDGKLLDEIFMIKTLNDN